MKIRHRLIPTLAAGLFLISGHSLAADDNGITIDSYTFGGIKARAIGPAVMSGRISALDAVAGPPATIFVGTASGGLWKSIDGGIGFKPVFDDHTQSIGAVKIAPSNPDTVWVGTGETWVRNTVSVGDGVYLSTDGGEKWQHKGLEKTERIAAIEVSPRDPRIAYVCATGALWNDSAERGVYKTTDGGEHWKKVLYVNEKTGCSDLAMDPVNPSTRACGSFAAGRIFLNPAGPAAPFIAVWTAGKVGKRRPAASPKATRDALPSLWRPRNRALFTPPWSPAKPPCTAPLTWASTGRNAAPLVRCKCARFISAN